MPPVEDNLFRESSMSFGDHLEALRGCLFRSLGGIFVCFMIGLFMGAPVMNIIQQPLTRSLSRFIEKRNQKKIQDIISQGYPADIAEKAYKSGLLVETVYLNKEEIGKTIYGLEADQGLIELQAESPAPNTAAVAPAESQAESPVPNTAAVAPAEPQAESPAPNTAAVAPAEAKPGELPHAETVNAETPNDPGEAKDVAPDVVEGSEEGPKTADESAQAELDAENFNSFHPWQTFLQYIGFGSTMPKAHSVKDQQAFNDYRKDGWVKVYVWKPKEDSEKTRTRALSTQEPFMIYLKASFLVGAVLSCPWVFYQIWMFIISGLYPHERKYVYVFFPMSVILFLAGALMAFFWVFDSVLAFLLLFNDMMNIEPELRINEWLGFVLMLPLGFGISFQLPLVMLFLERVGIMSVEGYLANWRLSVLGISIISMILTPADPTSMLLMFIPLTFLYFLGLLLCKYMPAIHSVEDDE